MEKSVAHDGVRALSDNNDVRKHEGRQCGTRVRPVSALMFSNKSDVSLKNFFTAFASCAQYKMKIDATLSPAELPALRQRDLRDTVCVVFDVLRATSVMVTALHNGAKAIVPVAEIEEALAVRQKQPDVLLGGERNGVKIRAAQTSGIDFDFGNSPREYTPEKVRSKTIVSTTTNGTRALLACAKAKSVLVGSFLNLSATARAVEQQRPSNLLLVCAGTRENTAL